LFKLKKNKLKKFEMFENFNFCYYFKKFSTGQLGKRPEPQVFAEPVHAHFVGALQRLQVVVDGFANGVAAVQAPVFGDLFFFF
jgi:hypothetical protein